MKTVRERWGVKVRGWNEGWKGVLRFSIVKALLPLFPSSIFSSIDRFHFHFFSSTAFKPLFSIFVLQQNFFFFAQHSFSDTCNSTVVRAQPPWLIARYYNITKNHIAQIAGANLLYRATCFLSARFALHCSTLTASLISLCFFICMPLSA